MELNTSDEILMYFKKFAIETAVNNPPIFSGDSQYRKSEIIGGLNYFSTICQEQLEHLKDTAPHGVLVGILEANLSAILSSVYNQYLANYTEKEKVSFEDFR